MVKEGDVLEITRQESLNCPVMFYRDDKETRVGMPYLEDIYVDLEKLEDKKDNKIVVARFRAKSRHRRKRGHRQPISVVKVKSIGIKGSVTKPIETDNSSVPAKKPKKTTVKKAVKVNTNKEGK